MTYTMSGWKSALCTLAGTALLLGAGITTSAAQEPENARQGTTRAELEAAAAAAEREAASGRLNEEGRAEKRFEAQAIRERLRDGDLQVGDRIALRVFGHEALTDTFVVRSGRTLMIPDLPEIPLHGVLRSELEDHLQQHLSRYVRDPRIEVVSLVRVGILGPVGRPGFYALPADMLLTDAIMYAGGPTNHADIRRSTVRRGRHDMITRRGFSNAVASGMTLDELNIRAGDEVVVGERSQRNWESTVRTVAGALGILLTIGLLAR